MATQEKDSFVDVYTGSRWQAEVIKGLLESNQIEAFLKDETLGMFGPNSGVVIVMVDNLQAEEAKKIIAENEKEH